MTSSELMHILNFGFLRVLRTGSSIDLDGEQGEPYMGFFVQKVPGSTLPTQVEFDSLKVSFEADKAKREHNDSIKRQMAALEDSISIRRIREAIKGSGKVWLDNVDDQITALRNQLLP